MRRLLAIILSVGAFLGGYHLGRQPGSPDLFGWAQETYPVVVDTVDGLAESLSDVSTGAADVNSRTP